jgi:WD40 repeat protein
MALGGSTGIRLYDAETMRETKHIDTQSWVKSLASSPDGRTLAAGPRDSARDLGDENEITLWDVDTGRLLRTVDAKDTGLVVAFGPDGHTLATQGYKAAQLWDVTTGERLHRLEGREIVVSPNLHIAMFEELHGPLTLWDLNSGKHLYTLEEKEMDVHRVTFSPDGHTLAISIDHQVGESDVIKVFDVESGQLLHTLEGPWYSYFLALSPDSRRLAAGGSDDVVQVWDLTTGHPLCTFTEQKYSYSLAFSFDGQRLASGNQDGSIQLWDTTTGLLLHTFKGHTAAVTHLAFSADETILASGSQDGTARLWHVDPPAPLPTVTPTPNAGTTTAILATQNAQLSTQVAAIETREAIPSLTPTPTPPPAPSAFYRPLYLDTPPANASTGFLDPPVGNVSMDDVPFQLSRMIFKSQASTPPYDDYPTSLRLNEEVAQAQKVHLLLNTGNGFTKFEGQVIGQVVAYCNNAPTVVADLRLGREVREWHKANNVVSTATHVRQVWNGYILSTPGEKGYIDLLSLDLPTACQEGRLTAIEIIDTSVETAGSLDPALDLFGITVEYH